MATIKERGKKNGKGLFGMNTPPIVSPDAWEAAQQQLLVKEKAHTRARDALGRRTPADAVDGRGEGVRIRGAPGQG
jgi:hypothetical protein